MVNHGDARFPLFNFIIKTLFLSSFQGLCLDSGKRWILRAGKVSKTLQTGSKRTEFLLFLLKLTLKVRPAKSPVCSVL